MAEIPDAIQDQQLTPLEGTDLHLCSAIPANYGEIAGFMLAEAVISGSHVKADHTSGRKTTTPAQSAMPITTTGNVVCAVQSNGVDTMLRVNTVTTQLLTSGGTVDTNAYFNAVRDPVDL